MQEKLTVEANLQSLSLCVTESDLCEVRHKGRDMGESTNS